MITHDASTRRFDIQGILRECLDVYNTIKDLSGTKHTTYIISYYTVFIGVITPISEKISNAVSS